MVVPESDTIATEKTLHNFNKPDFGRTHKTNIMNYPPTPLPGLGVKHRFTYLPPPSEGAEGKWAGSKAQCV